MRNLSAALLLALAGIFSGSLFGQTFDNGVPWNMPWNDTVHSDFLPSFLSGPIGEEDRVSTDGKGSFIVKGEPYRFFGGNLTAWGAFPDKTDAPAVAGRMNKYGLNLIRFHHIDNPWSAGSLFYGTNGTRTLNSDRLDRLDYLIAQLKQKGVYVNMNLNVSRTFELSDEVYAADSLKDYAKGVTQFDPHMKVLQKEYARDLLTHTNPYTGISLAADPVLAMVEIINENTLFRMWYGNELQPISEGGNLPTYYSAMLDSLWMDHLEDNYGSTEELEEVWNGAEAQGDTLFKDGFEEGISEQWKLELNGTVQGTATLSDEAASGNSAVKVEVTRGSDVAWHMNFKLTGLSVKKDSTYEIHFRAKAAAQSSFIINWQLDVSPYTWYQGKYPTLSTEYQDFKFTFKAPEDVNAKLRISFALSPMEGSFYLDDFVLKEQSLNGLEEGESLEERSVRRIRHSEVVGTSEPRVHDQTDFYTQLQLDFLREMKSYLVDSLDISVPITGSNWFTGPEMIHVQKEMDFIDNHSYWDHPQFPNNPWDSYDWTIKNEAMMTADASTIEAHFAGTMVRDKPFTISEYNHAAPNQFQAELLPIITSYLSFNDADGLMIFTYNGARDWEDSFVDGFFDIHRNPVLMSGFPLFSYAFRNNLIRPAEEVFTVDYSYKDMLNMPTLAENHWEFKLPYSKSYAYNTRMEITFDNETDFDPATLPAEPSSPYSLAGGEIYWDRSGLFSISTPQFASITGYLQDYQGAATDMMILDEGNNFAGLHWLSLTGQPLDTAERSILNISTRIMNEGMIWDGLTTVHNKWGGEPVQFCPEEVGVKLKSRFPWLRVYRLDEQCRADSSVSYLLKTAEDGFATFPIDMLDDQTLWYGIQEGKPSHDAKLSELLVNGSPVPGFHPDTLHYEVEVPGDAPELPVIAATTSDPNAFLKIPLVTEVPGTDTVVVIAQDDTTTTNYRIHFYLGVGVKAISSLPKAEVYARDGLLHIRCEESLVNGTVELYNITGAALFRKEIASTQICFELKNRGIYLVRIIPPDGSPGLSRKILIA